jgi:hypothetical protein
MMHLVPELPMISIAPIAALVIAFAADSIPVSIFLKERPADAKPVRAAKESAKKGERVVLTGRIGGRVAPFVAQRSVFLISDPSLKACSERPGDNCPTPWDFCCESRESMAASLATIQILGPDGKPLKVTAENAGGMKPLTTITVVGTVREVGAGGAFVIDATGIFVAEAKKSVE